MIDGLNISIEEKDKIVSDLLKTFNKKPQVPNYVKWPRIHVKDLYAILKEKKIKHKYKLLNMTIDLINDDPVLSINWAMYNKIAKKSPASKYIKEFKIANFIGDYEKLKELETYHFVNGTKGYQFISGITTLYGWREVEDYDVIEEKMKAWVNNDFTPDTGDKDFKDIFRQKIRKILNYKNGKLEMEKTLEEFCSNIVDTGTPGSAYDPGSKHMIVYIGDEEVKLRNTKYTKSMLLSTSEKMKRILTYKRQINNVTVKTEFYPKVRIIVSSDFDTNLKMTFVDQWLTSWMKGNVMSTLWQNKEQTLQMWMQMMNGKVNCPTDQTSFDHKVTKDMVLIMLEEITLLIEERAINNKELLEVMKHIKYALEEGTVNYTNPKTGKKTSLRYTSGILSGWKWTALFDTLANLAENFTAMELENTENKLITIYAQGDDIESKWMDKWSPFKTLLRLRSMGFEIHPKKSFISTHHNEFLRKYAIKGMLNGYPARLINGLLWQYPGEVPQENVLEKLNATTNVWVKLFERLLLNKEDAQKVVKQDLRGQKIDEQLIKGYLEIHPLNGGAGLTGERLDIEIEVTPEVKKEVSFNAQGIEDFKKQYGHLQEREMQSWLIKTMNIPKLYKKHSTVIRKSEVIIKKVDQPVIPYVLDIVKNFKPDKPKMVHGMFPNVVFSQSYAFMEYLYPNINIFTERSKAPKQWTYEWLSGRVKTLTPKIPNMSIEMAALLFTPYESSLYMAMMHKRVKQNSWKGYNLYMYDNFSTYVKNKLGTISAMY